MSYNAPSDAEVIAAAIGELDNTVEDGLKGLADSVDKLTDAIREAQRAADERHYMVPEGWPHDD